MKAQNNKANFTRRNFLKSSAALAGAFYVVPGSVLGLNGAEPASERINIAGIGIGGQGGSDLNSLSNQNIVALCDVDLNRGSGSLRRWPNARQYQDYRKMLDEAKDVDGVIVATPDHQHAFAAMAAIRAGKHVYCEKPLTHSVWEARELAKAARAAKVATQMGNQGQASEETRRLCEFVWSGIIGNVLEAHVWTDRPSRGLFDEYWPQGVARPKETPAVPDKLDWDMWIGPAPMRPYHPAYHPFAWRGWWDFGTGALGDIGCHALDPVFRALKLGAPTTVQAASTRVNTETYPLGSMVTYHFPARDAAIQANNPHLLGLTGKTAGEGNMPACKVVWYDGGLRPPRPEGLPNGAQMGDNGRLLIGEKGFILGNSIYPESIRGSTQQIAQSIPRSESHHMEWVRACKGGKPAGSSFDWAGPLAEAVLLGNVGLRVQLREDLTLNPLIWDSPSCRITNLEEANQFIRRKYREGWKLV